MRFWFLRLTKNFDVLCVICHVFWKRVNFLWVKKMTTWYISGVHLLLLSCMESFFFTTVFELWIINAFNSLRPGGTICRRRFLSTLSLLSVCCLTAPSHNMNPCCLITNWTIKNSLQWNSNQNTIMFMHRNAFNLPSAKCQPFCLVLS